MRLPLSKVYRAFPELDKFSDERCARFVAAVNTETLGLLLRLVTVPAVGVAALTIWLWVIGVVMKVWPAVPRVMERDWWVLWALVQAFCAVVLPVTAAFLVRDMLLRRQIRKFISARGTCKCGYLLLGLPVGADLKVICPECAAVTSVDVAMGELVTAGDGVRRFKPAEGGGL